MGLTRAEQETVIRWDEAEPEVRIWSASPKTWRRMARLGVAPYRETTTERTTDTETSYADRVLHEVQISAACGLDPDQAREVAGSLLAGLAKMAKALEDATYAPGEYEKIARSAAHAMKSADGPVRLMEFASGRPDSRADVGSDWLRALTAEQLAMVSGWIDANEQKLNASERP